MDTNGRRNRAVITGMGVLSCLGHSVDEYWDGLTSGTSGIAELTLTNTEGYPCKIGGEVRDFNPTDYVDRKESRRLARFSQLAIGATTEAIADAGLDISAEDPDRVAVLLGCGAGGLPETDQQSRILSRRHGMRMSPFFIPMMLVNMAAANVSRIFGATGYTNTCVTACAAGTQAIGEAAEVIRRGAADVMIAGGSEAAITPMGVGGFAAMRALSTRNDEPARASRPFDRERDGFIIGEGAGVIILEELERARRRGVPIHAEVVGYGMSADAYHVTAPAEDANGAVRVMQAALDDAGVEPSAVDYVNAHGTSTRYNDKLETLAIKKCFGDHARSLAISSTKSMTGHLLGAAGGLEAGIAALAVRDQVLPPTINLEYPDPDCDLDYVPNRKRNATLTYALSNSFGFGGTNASLLFKRYEDPQSAP